MEQSKDAIASFYGAGIPDTAFGPGPVALDRTPHITGTLHCCFGTDSLAQRMPPYQRRPWTRFD